MKGVSNFSPLYYYILVLFPSNFNYLWIFIFTVQVFIILYTRCHKLTKWLMEPGGSIMHSQKLSNDPYPESNEPQFLVLIPIYLRSILILSSHLCLGLPKDLFPEGIPAKILKAPLTSSILATRPAHLSQGIKHLA